MRHWSWGSKLPHDKHTFYNTGWCWPQVSDIVSSWFFLVPGSQRVRMMCVCVWHDVMMRRWEDCRDDGLLSGGAVRLSALFSWGLDLFSCQPGWLWLGKSSLWLSTSTGPPNPWKFVKLRRIEVFYLSSIFPRHDSRSTASEAQLGLLKRSLQICAFGSQPASSSWARRDVDQKHEGSVFLKWILNPKFWGRTTRIPSDKPIWKFTAVYIYIISCKNDGWFGSFNIGHWEGTDLPQTQKTWSRLLYLELNIYSIHKNKHFEMHP